ncbi:MAG: Na+:solute symporter [Victivallaceae bacterium]|nr:Na+:solute symporter [Victivallaceae bacterium]
MDVHLTILDWCIIGATFVLTMLIGIFTGLSAGRSKSDFFVGGRSMPWYLLGFSMVATTFSTDTPNLVTNFVRVSGVCGNWCWWAMLPSGMLTVFLYAKLWHRSKALTDVEFYELRYSGKAAAFLRGFRAVYLGFFFNVMVMASVTLAAIKIGGAILGLTPLQCVLGAMIVTTVFSCAGGLRGVLFSDFFLFIVATTGAVAAAYFAVKQPEVGGLSGLIAHFSSSDALLKKTEVFGFQSATDRIELFLIPITIVWWSVWYSGAEPGGGGFIVQRMLAAKSEKHAVGATLFFNVAHYAIRPWPWIVVALASIIVFPDKASLIRAAGNALPPDQIADDVAYSLMLAKMPAGWIGLAVASLAAAYVSTISTQLNWGASYLVNDFYARFLAPRSSEKSQVWAGRVFTVLLMIVSGTVALGLENALSTFQILLSIGAGTGLLFLLRWFWWRINAAAEITAMTVSFLLAVYFNIFHAKLFPDLAFSPSVNMIVSVFLTMICWLAAAFFGPETDKEQLYRFCRKINPAGAGWNAVRRRAAAEGVKLDDESVRREPLLPGIAAAFSGCVAIYAVLYGTGEFIYRRTGEGFVSLAVGAVAAALSWYSGVALPRRKAAR